jgi:uncharacterized membrane protein
LKELGDKEKQVALMVVMTATPSQNAVLRNWIGELLTIRNSNASSLSKTKQALLLTAKSKVIWPLIQMIAKQVKKVGWDDRPTSQRFGIGGVAVGIAFFGGHGAGIAALGTAVGVPLWIVLGAGSMFAQHLYAELVQTAGASEAQHGADEVAAEDGYKTIDLKRVDP